MKPFFWRCGLVLAVGLSGWLVGGMPSRSSSDDGSKEAEISVEEDAEENDQLRGMLEGEGTSEPSFVNASLRMLAALEKAGVREVEKARALLEDERYRLDPGFDLLRAVLERRYKERFPERYLESGLSGQEKEYFLRHWGERDPRAAFAAAMATGPEMLRLLRVRAVLEGARSNHVDVCLELLRGIGDADFRRRVARDVAWTAAYQHPEDYRELAEEFPDDSDVIHRAAFQELVGKDGAGAVAELEKVSPLFRSGAEGALLETWTASDPAAALAWAEAEGIPVPHGAYFNWARTEPAAALEAALGTRGEISNIGGFLHGVFDTARRTDPAAADAWLAGLDDESLRARLSMAAMSTESSAPTEAELATVRFALDHPDNARELNAGNFVARIPEAGARRDFVLSLAVPVQRRLMPALLPEWMRTDPVGMAAYVEALPSVRARVRVMGGALSEDANGSEEDKAALRNWAAANLDAQTRSRIPALQPNAEEVAP